MQYVAYLAFATCIYGGWIAFVIFTIRKICRPRYDASAEIDVLDLKWPDYAYLSGRMDAVFQAATVWMVERGILQYRADERRIAILMPLPEDAPRAVRDVYEWANLKPEGTSIDSVRTSSRHSLRNLFTHLEMAGLCLEQSRITNLRIFGVLQFLGSMVPFVIVAFSAQLLFFKDMVGLALSITKIAFWAGGGLVCFHFILFCYCIGQSGITSKGAALLKIRKREMWPNRSLFTFGGPPPGYETNLAEATAVFGDGVLKRTPLWYLIAGLSEDKTIQ